MVKASILLEFNDDLVEGTQVNPPYTKRPVVYLIVPDPFDLKTNINTNLIFGNRASADAGRKNESPILCYSLKLGLFGYSQWVNHVSPFSEQQIFDMQVSQMLRCNHVAVYGKEITDGMNALIANARNRMSRIHFRSI